MTHLVIQQKGIQEGGLRESVSSATIKHLYDAATDPNLVYLSIDQNGKSTDIKGDLLVNKTYLVYVQYLTAKYPQLDILTGTFYMLMADPVVEHLVASSYGDGVGITLSEAQSVGSQTLMLNGMFTNNTDITSFDELSSFTNATLLGYTCFQGCSNLLSVDLSNITVVQHYGGMGDCFAFLGCSSLLIINLPNATDVPLSSGTFLNCTSLRAIILPNATDYRTRFPGSLSVSQNMVYVQLGKAGGLLRGGMWTGLFIGQSADLTVVDFGNIETISEYTCLLCANLKAVVFRSSTVTLIQLDNSNTVVSMSSIFGGSTNVSIFVPDNLVTNYQQDLYWSSMASAFKPLSTYDLYDYVTADYHVKQSS